MNYTEENYNKLVNLDIDSSCVIDGEVIVCTDGGCPRCMFRGTDICRWDLYGGGEYEEPPCENQMDIAFIRADDILGE